MKKYKNLAGILCFSSTILLAQQSPTNTNPSGVASGTNDKQFWSRAGNTNTQGTNNIFGTMWNSPIWMTTNNAFRMAIFGGGTTQTDGRVAIGNNLPSTFTPLARLHLHQLTGTSVNGNLLRSDGINTVDNLWSMYTGATANTLTEKFHINSRTAINVNDVELKTVQNGYMKFFTNNAERMSIGHVGVASAPINSNPGAVSFNRTRVSISHNPVTPILRPLSLLHIGYDVFNAGSATNIGGWRPWMDVGMSVVDNTDGMYVGLKNEGPDKRDAIIAWNDNYATGPGGPDRLRMIFTGFTPISPGAMGAVDGLEFARYVPFHNTTLNINDPRIGFGDFNSLLPTNTIDPSNTIEINSVMAGFNTPANISVTGSYPASTGASGLRFRDLTSKSLVVPNTETAVDVTKVLTVDTLGNVVLINGGGSNFGNICGATAQNPLTSNWEIPMNNFNYRFADPAGINAWGKNYVGIGTSCLPTAKLDVNSPLTTNNPNAVVAINCVQSNLANNATFSGRSAGVLADVSANNKNNIGVYSTVKDATNNYGFYTQVNSAVSGSANQQNVGVYAEAARATSNYAMRGRSISLPTLTGGINVGGWFSAENNSTRIGVMGDINGASFILPTLFPFNSAVGVYGNNPSAGATEYAGYFEGKVNINGNLLLNGALVITSDATLKTNVDSIQNATAILNQIQPKTFYFDTTNTYGMRFPSQKQYGVIAQQVETILPELVINNYKPAMVDSAGTIVYQSKNFKTVNYNAFIGLLIQANHEQQRKIDSLITKTGKQDSINNAVQQQIAALASQINGCCSNANARHANTTINNQVDVELNDKEAIVLKQNVPNPFAEQTTITYNVPESVGKAQIIFYNSAGQIIQTVDIKTRGKGKVNVFASDLSSGIYHYTLVADGKVIDSKKMMRE
ncbi:MAG: tail fiber domain-containing protein [Bacteroidota bacterium]